MAAGVIADESYFWLEIFYIGKIIYYFDRTPTNKSPMFVIRCCQISIKNACRLSFYVIRTWENNVHLPRIKKMYLNKFATKRPLLISQFDTAKLCMPNILYALFVNFVFPPFYNISFWFLTVCFKGWLVVSLLSTVCLWICDLVGTGME